MLSKISRSPRTAAGSRSTRASGEGASINATRVDLVWCEDDEAEFLKTASPHLHLPLVMALWTGQRQGDLLRLPWSAYDGESIRLKQSKTGERVLVPVGAPLKAMLDATPRRSPIILVNSRADRGPQTGSGPRSSKPATPPGSRA